MIFYATKQTRDRYNIPLLEDFSEAMQIVLRSIREKEQGSCLYEWGCKLFYFDRRKCLQFMHFETKFVVFLVDIKKKDLQNITSLLYQYLLKLYEDDVQMCIAIEEYFNSSPIGFFDKLTDRSIISSLNRIQSNWAWDGQIFYNYLHDNILHTLKINMDVNDQPVTMKGKSDYIFPYKYFAKTLKEHFPQKQPNNIIQFPR